MLTKLTLRNFRAFRAQSFNFARINVFVGPNNSGKSSAISAINLLAQTINDADANQSQLVLNGPFDQLGTYLDVVHGGRANTPIGIDFSLDNTEVRTEYKYRSQRREIELTKYEFIDSGRQIYQYSSKKDTFEIKYGGERFEDLFPQIRKRKPRFVGGVPINLSPYELRQEVDQFTESQYQKARAIDRPIRNFRMKLRDTFMNFDSISPFRDKPQRTYLYTGETAQRIGVTGSNTTLILSTDSSRRGSEGKGMLAEIARWFKAAGIAEDIRVKALTPRHFEIVVVDRHNNEHNICDVGFGCSQVLPVLAAGLNLFGRYKVRPSILIVQEPEIHLHPNAQALLASFFVNLVSDTSQGQVFIETHSDTFLLRIARHVAEGVLDPKDVRIFYVSKPGASSEVQPMTVNERGGFSPDWPGGFFPHRQSESLELARAFAKRRSDQLEFSYPEERN
jgi:predicted ATPase